MRAFTTAPAGFVAFLLILWPFTSAGADGKASDAGLLDLGYRLGRIAPWGLKSDETLFSDERIRENAGVHLEKAVGLAIQLRIGTDPISSLSTDVSRLTRRQCEEGRIMAPFRDLERDVRATYGARGALLLNQGFRIGAMAEAADYGYWNEDHPEPGARKLISESAAELQSGAADWKPAASLLASVSNGRTSFKELRILIQELRQNAREVLVRAAGAPRSDETRKQVPVVSPQVAPGMAEATRDRPWTNSLGMPFVPIPETRIMACVWETRVADFEAFVRATGHDATSGMLSIGTDGWKERGYSWNRPGFPQGPAHPVCGVSWEDARAFCLWLTKKEKESGLLQPGQCYRLPNDGEWSLAVGLGRETGDTPEAKSRGVPDVYPWGRAWPPPRNAGNYAGEESLRTKPANWTVLTGYNDGYEGTSPVGAFGANELGLFDMGGNVKEWCLDECNPPDTSRVLRGASWRFDHPLHLLSSCRFAEPKEVRCDNHGFRCVLYRGPP